MLYDRLAISDLLAQYCRGIDRLDEQQISDVYWEDATDDHGVFNGRAAEFAAFIVPLLDDLYLSTLHLLGQSSVVIEGDAAAAETYFHAQHKLRIENGSLIEHVGGRYVDKLARRSGQWKILKRTVVFDFVTRVPSVPSEIAMDGFVFGKKSRDDLSYENFSVSK